MIPPDFQPFPSLHKSENQLHFSLTCALLKVLNLSSQENIRDCFLPLNIEMENHAV